MTESEIIEWQKRVEKEGRPRYEFPKRLTDNFKISKQIMDKLENEDFLYKKVEPLPDDGNCLDDLCPPAKPAPMKSKYIKFRDNPIEIL